MKYIEYIVIKLKLLANPLIAGMAFICSGLGYLLGFDKAVGILIWFVVADYITGLMSGYINQKLDSDIGRTGVCRKVGLFIAVGLAHGLDLLMNTEGTIRNAIVWFFIGIEGISATENLAEIGVPIPKKLQESLLQLRDKGAGD